MPLLLHGAGGMGKTVLMQALARHYEEAGAAVVLFDGFGGGRWRDPADARHLPGRALVHMANLLAGRGLCDVLLPSSSTEDLIRAFCGRLAQAIQTLRRPDPSARLAVLLDAIDHAGSQAADTKTVSFAHLLLQSLSVNPIDGVVLVASCRTERRDIACGGADCRELEIPPFSVDDTERLARQCDPGSGRA